MTEIVRATLTVNFSGASDSASGSSLLKWELDSTRDGNLNAGKTSFRPNSTAYLLLFKSSNVSLLNVAADVGSLGGGSSVSYTVEEDITFSASDSASLSYPVAGGLTLSWAGKRFDANGSQKSISVSSDGDFTLVASEPVIGRVSVSYTTSGRLYNLYGVPESALVLAVGSVS